MPQPSHTRGASSAAPSGRAQAADLTACRAFLRERSPKLYWTSLALPPRVRSPASAVFAFFRRLTDMAEEREVSASTTVDLRERMRAAYSNPKNDPIDRAFGRVVTDHALPRALGDALVEGLTWDVEGRRYATYEGLLDHCVRTGATAALATVLLTGRRSAVVLERAVDLGVAIELTRIARDVGDDARRGRVYLPIEWLEEAGGDADGLLHARTATPGIRAVTKRILQAADAFYLRADPGIGALPFDCRPAVRGARYVFSAIGQAIEDNEYDSITRDATLPLWRIARVLARATRPARSETRPLVSHPLREAEPLLRAITGP